MKYLIAVPIAALLSFSVHAGGPFDRIAEGVGNRYAQQNTQKENPGQGKQASTNRQSSAGVDPRAASNFPGIGKGVIPDSSLFIPGAKRNSAAGGC
jgi:hypothetical protein